MTHIISLLTTDSAGGPSIVFSVTVPFHNATRSHHTIIVRIDYNNIVLAMLIDVYVLSALGPFLKV